jgi:chemotaxis protein MotB
VTTEERGVVVSLGDRVLFNVGEAGIKEEATPALSAIASVIAGIPNDISIEGHTDNVPISNSRYSSNWELSTSRAVSVLEFLVRKRGLSPARFSAAGYAEFRPVAPNETRRGVQETAGWT